MIKVTENFRFAPLIEKDDEAIAQELYPVSDEACATGSKLDKENRGQLELQRAFLDGIAYERRQTQTPNTLTVRGFLLGGEGGVSITAKPVIKIRIVTDATPELIRALEAGGEDSVVRVEVKLYEPETLNDAGQKEE